MGKLQVCLSFKNTKEEMDLYEYVIGQTDKSVFLKNLIRDYKNGVIRTNDVPGRDSDADKDDKEQVEDIKIEVPKHGKKTKSKFLV